MSKLPQVKPEQVKRVFEQETGLSASHILEIADAFPAGRHIHIYTKDRTFIGLLDSSAKLKPGTLQEEK